MNVAEAQPPTESDLDIPTCVGINFFVIVYRRTMVDPDKFDGKSRSLLVRPVAVPPGIRNRFD